MPQLTVYFQKLLTWPVEMGHLVLMITFFPGQMQICPPPCPFVWCHGAFCVDQDSSVSVTQNFNMAASLPKRLVYTHLYRIQKNPQQCLFTPLCTLQRVTAFS